ncbi:hypothetical protein ACJ5NV_13360 [Loktanella agnita]|uniref:hypothetical protein n=1 Tax=Loktanella agnita TaxID=287097 RepID=UPI0039870B27
MNEPAKNGIFLERASYRRRRLQDAARLVPVLGAILWTIPLLWPEQGDAGADSARAVTYTFGVWVFLIIITAIISHYLRSDEALGGPTGTD